MHLLFQNGGPFFDGIILLFQTNKMYFYIESNDTITFMINVFLLDKYTFNKVHIQRYLSTDFW